MRPSTSEFVISVPGQFRGGSAFLDLETQKVPAPEGFRMKNGELLRRRWSIVMYGVALNGTIRISANDANDEAANLAGLGDIFADLDQQDDKIVYAATRKFDEMIAKGKFTNARRAHEDFPFFPYVKGSELYRWFNLGPIPDSVRRLRVDDLPSKGISYQIEHNWEGVAVHLLRDVVSLIYMDGDPSPRCSMWIRRVLSSTKFAREQIMAGER